MTSNIRTSLTGLIAAMVAWAASNAQAINLLVYNTNNSGPGSLRQAVSDNNALGGNTIVFSNVVFGTITLTSGELLITKNATILGPGANVLAVSGNAASRVFNITNATVTISGLTITNGVANGTSYPDGAGGGIFIDGFNGSASLTVSNCTVSGNSAESGGGILNNGNAGSATLSVIASTLSGNLAFVDAGGIYNLGVNGNATLTVSNCTVSGNSASSTEGGGGGIVNNGNAGSATLSVIASTLSGNSASEGEGGGILNYGFNGSATLTIGDTILKAGASGGTIANASGTVTSQGYNLSSDGGVVNTGSGTGNLTGVGDQINTDPMLGPLQDNGGPTFTHAPLPGSPAIDQGKSFGLTTDQRGRPRTFDNPSIPNATLGDGTDIGAVEVSPPVTLIVSNTNNSGIGSLRQAIVDAAPGDSIAFASGVSGTITLTTGELLIDKKTTIIGPTAAGVTASGNNASRVFHITAGPVVLVNLTIANGNVGSGFGGGIFNDHSTLTVSNCTLSGNSATAGGTGGGIYNFGANSGSAMLTIVNSTLNGNSAFNGGGIFNTGAAGGSATLTVKASTLSGNSAGNIAGGIYNSGSGGSATLTIGDTILKAGVSGENIFSISGSITDQGYNLSSDSGGGFLAATGDQVNTDPLLGPLQDNGGPTPTMTLRVGSPAIDKGKRLGLSTDQRGQLRPYNDPNIANASGGDGSDIGAYEASELRITAVQKVGSNLRLDFTSMLGTNYEVQSRSDLSVGSWGSLPGSTPGNGGVANTTVNNPFGQPRQFYRIHPVP